MDSIREKIKSEFVFVKKNLQKENEKSLYPLLLTAILGGVVTGLSRGKKIPFTKSYSKISGVFGLAAYKIPFTKSNCEEKTHKNQSFSSVPYSHPLRDQVGERLIGHEADFVISGTYLEGSTLKENVRHLETFAKLSAEKGSISAKTGENLESFFKAMQFIPASSTTYERIPLAEQIANKVLSLKPGESLPVEGGWSESGGVGHALIYQFIKKEEGLYDIYLYNTGAGTEQYHAKKIVEEGIKKKTLICPYVKFQGVNLKKVDFKKAWLDQREGLPGFFEELIRIGEGMGSHSLDHLYGASKYNLGDLTGFGAFSSNRAKPDHDTLYITGQRSGSCAFSVVLAAIRPLFERALSTSRCNT